MPLLLKRVREAIRSRGGRKPGLLHQPQDVCKPSLQVASCTDCSQDSQVYDPSSYKQLLSEKGPGGI